MPWFLLIGGWNSGWHQERDYPCLPDCRFPRLVFTYSVYTHHVFFILIDHLLCRVSSLCSCQQLLESLVTFVQYMRVWSLARDHRAYTPCLDSGVLVDSTALWLIIIRSFTFQLIGHLRLGRLMSLYCISCVTVQQEVVPLVPVRDRNKFRVCF